VTLKSGKSGIQAVGKQKVTSHQNKWRKKSKMILLYFKTVFVLYAPVKEMFSLVPSA
jgi:hypothetical protein